MIHGSLGIDRAAYDKQALKDLREAPEELKNKLDQAQAMIRERQQRLFPKIHLIQPSELPCELVV